MKKIPIKSGGHAFICKDSRSFIPGEVCFEPEEWDYAKRLSGGFSDPEEKKGFWETLLEKKRMCSTYSVFDDFPLDTKPPPTGSLVDYVGRIIEKLKSEGILR